MELQHQQKRMLRCWNVLFFIHITPAQGYLGMQPSLPENFNDKRPLAEKCVTVTYFFHCCASAVEPARKVEIEQNLI
jgi:hypothetical protein